MDMANKQVTEVDKDDTCWIYLGDVPLGRGYAPHSNAFTCQTNMMMIQINLM